MTVKVSDKVKSKNLLYMHTKTRVSSVAYKLISKSIYIAGPIFTETTCFSNLKQLSDMSVTAVKATYKLP